jgi:hypothetical protein
MRFQKGVHYPHPPRGRARRPYHVSDAARRARRRNLSRSRLRSDRESAVIKLLIWQSCFDDGPCPSQRILARKLGVWPSYVCKVQKQSSQALGALAKGIRVTLADLYDARRFAARLKQQEPRLPREVRSSRCEKGRVPTEDEIIAATWREVAEWKRKNLSYGGRGWFRR